MEEIYKKLNHYLNEICKYLERKDSFLLTNILSISKLNDAFLKYIDGISLKSSTKQILLTYDEVFRIAREIVGNIDENYLSTFDNLLPSGELDFSFEHEYPDSVHKVVDENGNTRQLININRNFNYEDVRILIHEFMHYTNGLISSANRYYLTEFLSIYFELFASDYMYRKGISPFELDPLIRLRSMKRHAENLSEYELILLAYSKFGPLNVHTVKFLQKYIIGIEKETFEEECKDFYEDLCAIVDECAEEIESDPNSLGQILSEDFITANYRYFLSPLLAFYARAYSNFDDIAHLANHLCDYDNMPLSTILISIGIDIRDEHFPKKSFEAIKEYIEQKQREISDITHAKI